MNTYDTDQRDSWVYTLLGEQNFQRQRGFFPWWYRLTAPPDPGPQATLKQRDLARRSTILSALASGSDLALGGIYCADRSQ
ncbi:MAG: hypothetical protein ACRDHZ_07730 [Ktedonobacteraceae bacterium]